MEFEIYMPCEPKWVCDGLLMLFALLGLLGLGLFVYILFKEYQKIGK